MIPSQSFETTGPSKKEAPAHTQCGGGGRVLVITIATCHSKKSWPAWTPSAVCLGAWSCSFVSASSVSMLMMWKKTLTVKSGNIFRLTSAPSNVDFWSCLIFKSNKVQARKAHKRYKELKVRRLEASKDIWTQTWAGILSHRGTFEKLISILFLYKDALGCSAALTSTTNILLLSMRHGFPHACSSATTWRRVL